MRFIFEKRMLFLLIFAKSLENAYDLPMILKFQGSLLYHNKRLQGTTTSIYGPHGASLSNVPRPTLSIASWMAEAPLLSASPQNFYSPHHCAHLRSAP